MRPFLFFAAAGAWALSAARAAEPRRFESGPARVALIELYTSEGCSSCPPAEKWLGTLRDDAGLWKTFVPIAWHVNYWDNLGWPDRFASREGTQREYAYAEAWGSGHVYTPCFVRDGAEWRGPSAQLRAGGGKNAASAPFDELRAGGAPGNLIVSYDGAVLRAEFAPAEAKPGGKFEIHAALLGGGIVSKVTAGENRGETLAHEFVALALVHGAPGAAIALPKKTIAGVTRHALAVWVTKRGELTPLQATGGWVN
ncbi:MAG: DUF1223 domain-containing protein [Verrucomicrobia bacterium]|nr:DUF1223 domain-containing protein [Verrucomicrobiota bacterium]